MSELKKKSSKPITGHKFPRKEIVDHVESEGGGFLLLADKSDESKIKRINSFGTEGLESYKLFEEKVNGLAKKLKVKATLKVFLILE